MRLKLNPKPKLLEGDTRTITKFLLLPNYLDNEWRWLERAKQKQVVMKLTQIATDGETGSRENTFLKWVSIGWE